MKYIKIFLAMSEADMKEEKAELADYIRSLNDLYVGRGIFFERCEPRESDADYIDESQYFFLIFYREADEKIIRDFDVAIEKFNVNAAPKIVTYFKIAEENSISEGVRSFMERLEKGIEHFYNKFESIDTVKLSMLLEMARSQETKLDIEFRDGKIFADKREVENISLDNIPQYFRNEALNKLREERVKLEEKYIELRKAIGENPDNDELFKTLYYVNERKNIADEQFHQIEMDILKMTSNIVEMTSDGKPLTTRAKKAVEYFNAGDYENCKNILDDEERRRAWERADEKEAVIDEEREGLINEIRIKVDTIKAQGINNESEKAIIELYEEAKEKIFEYNLNLEFIVNYIGFLLEQNCYKEGLDIGYIVYRKIEKEKNIDYNLIAEVLLCLGELHFFLRDYQEAENMYFKVIKMYEDLRGEYEIDNIIDYRKILCVYNDVGVLYEDIRKYGEAKKYYQKALEINGKLNRTSGIFLFAKSLIYHNLGSICEKLGDYDGALSNYNAALKTRGGLIEEIKDKIMKERPNIETYEVSKIIYEKFGALLNALANTYMAIGVLLKKLSKNDKSEEMFRYSINIRKWISEVNYSKYIIDLAESFVEMGSLFEKKDYMKAEKFYFKARDIYEKLDEYKVIYRMARIHLKLGILYSQYMPCEKAEDEFIEALKVFKKLCEKDCDLYVQDIATVYTNLGTLYYINHRNYEAEKKYIEALDIYYGVNEKNCGIDYEGLYILSTNLIDFYKEKLHYTRAIETCKKVLQIYDEIQNSEINIVCIKNVAIINLTLGELYCEIENYIEAETKYIKAYKLFEKLKFLNERIYMGGVLGSCSKLGELYEMQERYEEAEKQYRLLIEICREKRYTDFEAYLMRSIALYLKLVLLYKKVGKYSEVKTAYNKIQEYREQLIRRKNMNRF